MNKVCRQPQWSLISIFTTIISVAAGVLLVNAKTAPVSAEPAVEYEQNVPANQPQSFIFGSPIPTPMPVDPYTGQAPSRDYSYPANNFPPAVTYSYPVNVPPVTSYYSYPANGPFPGTSYYSYPIPGTVVNSGPFNPIIINRPGHHTWFRGGRY
ncbi:MAG: hypothetical protein JOZ78_08580 [Chroococcidiopsidaceae cyanobacterium CP_BM_ER_R8_30]|nr:hypothetical protein [Chroococcidiopsidaceae cyanobacterium CP_BM_ER_R8_30]